MKSSPKKQASHSLRFYQRWWILLNALSDGLLSHMWQAIVRFSKHGTREAAALSYYAIFSLFPLLLLVIIVIGTALGPAAARNQIDTVLRLFLPPNTANFLQDNIAQALEQRGSFGLVAGVSLLWSSLGLFSSLSSALSRTFRDENPRNTWHQRLVGLSMMIALSVLLMA
ncbi:MAG: YihY/virulence factor BrkB family protein, partial [Chloroflexi bacterium]|nr:YihY/virulence factor BrkB family protein [Chloroflexota bacterium]